MLHRTARLLVFFGLLGSRVALGEIRITSYNVCYTKLLRHEVLLKGAEAPNQILYTLNAKIFDNFFFGRPISQEGQFGFYTGGFSNLFGGSPDGIYKIFPFIIVYIVDEIKKDIVITSYSIHYTKLYDEIKSR